MNAHTSSSAFQKDYKNYATSGSSVTTAAFPRHRVLIPGSECSWLTKLEERFGEILKLPPGWDGYGGQPVAFLTAKFAAQIIEQLYSNDVPEPSIVPGSDGSMQIEWHVNGYDVELDVLAPQNVAAYRFDHQTEKEEELDIEIDFTEITKWISELSIERGIQAQIPA